MTRLIGERACQAPLPRHVVEDGHGADYRAAAVADRRRRFLNRDFLRTPSDEHRVIHRACRVAAPERPQERIFNGLAGHLIDQIQHICDRPPTRLRNGPPREGLGGGVEIVDAAVRVGADDRIADRGERHLRALLLREYRLLSALALGYIGDSALVADDSARGIMQSTGVLKHDQLCTVAPPHVKLVVPDFPFALDAPAKLGAIVRIPIKYRDAGQRVHLLSTRIAQERHERRVDRQQSPVARALIDALGDGLEKPAELGLAAAQGRFGKPPLDRNAGKLRGVRHELRFARTRQAGVHAVYPERSEYLAARSLDRCRPCSAQPRIERQLAPLLPERIALQIRDQYLAPQMHSRGARSAASIDAHAVKRGTQTLRETRRHDAGEAAAIIGQHADRAGRADVARLNQARDRFKHRRQRCVCRELLEYIALGGGDPLGLVPFGHLTQAHHEHLAPT